MTEEKKDVMNEEQEAQAVLQIQRIYVKDIFHIFSIKNGNRNCRLIYLPKP